VHPQHPQQLSNFWLDAEVTAAAGCSPAAAD